MLVKLLHLYSIIDYFFSVWLKLTIHLIIYFSDYFASPIAFQTWKHCGGYDDERNNGFMKGRPQLGESSVVAMRLPILPPGAGIWVSRILANRWRGSPYIFRTARTYRNDSVCLSVSGYNMPMVWWNHKYEKLWITGWLWTLSSANLDSM